VDKKGDTVTKLEKLYFLQAGKCYYCKQEINIEKASVEHLLAKANGGTDNDENCVMCCKTINNMFGAMPLKEKIAILVAHGSSLSCPEVKAARTPIKAVNDDKAKKQTETPKKTIKTSPTTKKTTSTTTKNTFDDFLKYLHQSGKRRPKKIETLLNSINSFFSYNSLIKSKTVLKKLVDNGIVVLVGDKVTYEQKQ
jgi:hypothetical protein